ncbi:hypothetical protein [Streptomyces marispadix]|uniref:Uncharacterized protein n=1 Tax=Streptomyces marispadix TaxID=2922868 RepID=A0ABS9SXF0_9ACTN|nr:hypothetical protein [Streptomyces marispadix]MCH6160931.1 hypothetical protein [Streptomyces marispadix]
MTAHSGRGQGDPPLYEGVVLPANGDPWTPEQQRQVAQTHGQPPAGQPWGEPWGPESQAAVASGSGAGAPSLPSAAQTPLPPPPPEQPPTVPAQYSPQSSPQHSPQNPPGHSPQQPLSGFGAETAEAPGGRHGGGSAPPSVSPSSGVLPSADLPPADLPLPPVQPPASGGAGPSAVQPPQGAQSFYAGAQPTRDQQPPGAQQFGQAAAGPMPAPGSASTTDATQYIPPVPGAPPGPEQFPAGHAPPVASAPAADADATQMLPPQTGQAPVRDPESTAQLRTPLPPEASPGGQGGQAQQSGQQPRPPAGFESLFRSEPGSGQGAADGSSGEPGSTQSLPIFDRAVARQRSGGVGGLGKSGGPAVPGPNAPGASGAPGAYGQGQPPADLPQGRAARRNAERSTLSRMSPGILVAVAVVVVAGVGMVAGAAMSGDEEKGAKPKNESSAAPAGEKSAGADPVEAQAKELDKLLDDSNNSRATVIRSVENIKSCKKLGPSARDLRAAAGQRNSLVARLGQLKTDKIPGQAELKSALTRGWKASASADNHYAAWADQTAGKKGCRKGKARPTAHVGLGARASGEATAAKKQAAGLWNPTAKKYGLKQRQVGQL